MTDSIFSQYRLERPSHESLLEALARYVGDDEAGDEWNGACQRAGVDRLLTDTAPEQLMAVIAELEASGGHLATCAKGLRIRLMTYTVLARKLEQTPTPADR